MNKKDEKGRKIGYWELDEIANNFWKGNFVDGVAVGKWVRYNKGSNHTSIIRIFDTKGNEISAMFMDFNGVSYHNYKNTYSKIHQEDYE